MKKRVGILFGGKSGEHEISLLSAAAVLSALDKEKYIPVPIGIDKSGSWFIVSSQNAVTQVKSAVTLKEKKESEGEISADKEEKEADIYEIAAAIEENRWMDVAKPLSLNELSREADFILPVLHGINGEDGTIQGLLEILNIPYGGCGVLASSLCMDKAMAKEIFYRKNIPTCRYILTGAEDLKNAEKEEDIIRESEDNFSYPVFIKPANAGSSLGITKAENREELKYALRLAAKFDRRILIEEAIDAREIEVAVVGNDNPRVSTCGEIIAADSHKYYDYDAKYSDDSGTMLVIPADISNNIKEEIRSLARKAYIATDCSGFARVDTFYDRKTGRVLINEINTIPGLTKYSLFPRLWEEEGTTFTDILTEIVELGYERYNDKNNR